MRRKKIEYPVFTWDWYQIGGRYSACLKLKVDGEDSENREHYNWGYLENNPRNERLFHSALLSELKRNAKVPFAYTEESYFPNMGCIYDEDVDEYDFRKTWFAHEDDYDMNESEWRELQPFEKVIAWMPLPEPYKGE